MSGMNHTDLMGFGPLISRISCADANADAGADIDTGAAVDAGAGVGRKALAAVDPAIPAGSAKALCPTISVKTRAAAVAHPRNRGAQAEWLFMDVSVRGF
jgi:hypothetical protein